MFYNVIQADLNFERLILLIASDIEPLQELVNASVYQA